MNQAGSQTDCLGWKHWNHYIWEATAIKSWNCWSDTQHRSHHDDKQLLDVDVRADNLSSLQRLI